MRSALPILIAATFVLSAQGQEIKGIRYLSTADNTKQPAMFFAPKSKRPVPLMAGRHPKMWAGVSAWVPISDLKAWHAQSKTYRKAIAKSCGGAPGDSKAVDEEYRKRSPLTYMANAKSVKLHISAGIHDGHKGSVPISHSLLAFNKVAEKKDQISDKDIAFFVEKAEVPPHLKKAGKKGPLFRRTSGNATITIFNGGHQILIGSAIKWIEKIHKNKKK